MSVNWISISSIICCFLFSKQCLPIFSKYQFYKKYEEYHLLASGFGLVSEMVQSVNGAWCKCFYSLSLWLIELMLFSGLLTQAFFWWNGTRSFVGSCLSLFAVTSVSQSHPPLLLLLFPDSQISEHCCSFPSLTSERRRLLTWSHFECVLFYYTSSFAFLGLKRICAL